ncbi:MAG: futalosine hydrolase [Desulfovibrionaceae bacterium]|nr:futalosine hydrolase [Desulfovibrionaceae bacterium]
MALLVCAATGQELSALAPSILPAPEKLEELRLWMQPLKGRDTLFCITGVGPVNAALALGFCFGQTVRSGQGDSDGPHIDCVLNVGLAGAFDLEARPLRSLCLVREEIWPEYGLNDGQSVTARAFSFPLWRRPDGMGNTEDVYDCLPLAGLAALEESIAGAAPSARARNWASCRSLSVAGVSASFARARDLWGRYRADLENMEGFAVAYACARAHVPCIGVRSVSNKVGPRQKDEKDFPGALKALAQVLPSLNLL